MTDQKNLKMPYNPIRLKLLEIDKRLFNSLNRKSKKKTLKKLMMNI